MEIETVLISSNIGSLYLQLLEKLLNYGKNVYIGRTSVRTKEIMGMQLRLSDLRSNVFSHPMRKLNYRFMLAEWLWIQAGKEDLETLKKFNSRYEEYSDNGVTLAGAYGPRLMPQWEYLLNTLRKDPTSRQAVASIWTTNPEPTRDCPCTLSCQFLVRENKLNAIFTMRSSDAFLGIPYDVFSFTQLANGLAGELNLQTGSFVLNLGSSHLYEKDYEAAKLLLENAPLMESYQSAYLPYLPVKASVHVLNGAHFLDEYLRKYSSALHSKSSVECFNQLKSGGVLRGV